MSDASWVGPTAPPTDNLALLAFLPAFVLTAATYREKR